MGLIDNTPTNSDYSCDATGCTAKGSGVGMGFPPGWIQAVATNYDANGNPLPGSGGKVLCPEHAGTVNATLVALYNAENAAANPVGEPAQAAAS